jgi:hypothetical protein
MGVPESPDGGTTKESLREEIAQLGEQIWAAQHQPNHDRDFHRNLDLEEWTDRREHCIAVLRQWSSDDLIKEAIRWGVEVPDRPDWWTEYKSVGPSTINPQTMSYKWLNDVGLSMISKQVRDERFEYWKGWAQILVPILSLLVAIIAMLKR